MKKEVKNMKKGICVAGNMIVDITYHIERWPNESELTTITGDIVHTPGGAVCNVITDLAVMDPNLSLQALGVIGEDQEGDFILDEMGKHSNIDTNLIKRTGRTSFTAVMSNNESKTRTFFQYRGSNVLFDESFIDWGKINGDLLHIGYILLLDALDQPDKVYGTKMARLLSDAQAAGLKTSIDVVTETGDRFKTLVRPALRYTDYCVINELEAQQVTGVLLRDEKERLYPENMEIALKKMKDLGVSTWAVIHCPEGGYGLNEEGSFVTMESLHLPKGYIKGTVGAGDAFCAGVLYGAETNKTLEESIRLGICASGASLSCQGATEGMRSVNKLQELYRRYKQKG